MGYQLTLFGPRGADYALHITSAPPSFWTMRRLCHPNQLVLKKIIAAVIAVIIAILIIVVIAVFGPPTLGKLLVE